MPWCEPAISMIGYTCRVWDSISPTNQLVHTYVYLWFVIKSNTLLFRKVVSSVFGGVNSLVGGGGGVSLPNIHSFPCWHMSPQMAWLLSFPVWLFNHQWSGHTVDRYGWLGLLLKLDYVNVMAMLHDMHHAHTIQKSSHDHHPACTDYSHNSSPHMTMLMHKLYTSPRIIPLPTHVSSHGHDPWHWSGTRGSCRFFAWL